MLFIALGLCNSGHGLYQIPITADLGINRAQFATIATMRFAFNACCGFLFGPVVKKIGLKSTIIFGFILTFISFILLSLGRNDALFYFTIGGMIWGIGGSLTSNTAASAVVSRYFTSNKGKVLGLMMSASGIGGMIFVIIIQRWLDTFGWRVSFRITSIALIIGILAFAILFKEKEASETLKIEESGCLFRDEIKKLRFYELCLTSFIAGMVTDAVYVITPAQMYDKGLGDSASKIYSFIFICIGTSKIIAGIVQDKIGSRKTFILNSVFNMASIFIMLNAKSVYAYIIYALVLGLSIPMENLSMSLTIENVYGKRDYPTFMGISGALTCFGISAGSKIIGLSYDKYGSYDNILYVMLILTVLVLLLYIHSTKEE